MGTVGRDAMIDRWRSIRHRRLKPWIPEGLKVLNEDLWFNDPLPEFVVNRLKQRLGANPVKVAVHVRGDAGVTLQRKGEQLEDWFKGVIEELDPLGLADGSMREHQVADGDGYFELEMRPAYSGPGLRRAGESDADYDRRIDEGRRAYGLPLCLSSPDPRSIYSVSARGKLKIVAKVVNVPLVDIRNNWTPEGFRLVYKGEEHGKLDRDMITTGELPPAPSAAEWGRMCRLVVIADDANIYHCVYQNSMGPGMEFSDDQGQENPLILLATYPNPLGHPPFYEAPARRTSASDPAERDLPLALEVLETAPYVNQVRTMRMIHAIIEAQKPIGLKPRMVKQGQENAGPKHFPDMWKFGFMEYDGDFVEIPTPGKADLDLLDQQVTNAMQSFNLSLIGLSQAGVVGKATAAWSIQQFNEEQVSLLQEALDNRAGAWREVLLDVATLIKRKYGKDGPVYVSSRTLMKKKPEVGRVDLEVGMSARDFDIPFRLDVSINGMTQGQRTAETEYWRRIWGEGRISNETYDERIGIEDRIAEEARRDREAIAQPMRESARAIAWEMAKANLRTLHGPMAEIVLAGFPSPVMVQPPVANQEGQAGEYAHGPDTPGQGMATTIPEPKDRMVT